MADMISILNAINTSASTEYQDRVPLATRNNITAVGNPLTGDYSPIQNEFLNALVGRIAMTIIKQKVFKNPLSVLKKGSVPLGSDIQEIFVDMAKDQGFDGVGDKLLTQTKPTVETIYHRINRRSQYPITISREQLQTAFVSYDKLEEFLSTIVKSLYSGDAKDEFILMKNTFASAITGGKIVTCEADQPVDEATCKAFLKQVRHASSYFTYPGSNFNKYADLVVDADPIETWTPKEDQILIIRSDVVNEIDIEYLAGVFNLEKAEIKNMMLEVDSFGAVSGGASDCWAILCDRSFVEVRDNLSELTSFYNAQGMYYNYWYNHFQTYSLSLFANAVAFVKPAV